MDKDDIWAAALDVLLKNEETDNPKSVFLHLLTPFDIFKDQYVLLAENAQVESWVNKYYLAEMQTAISAVSGTKYDVRIKSKTSIDMSGASAQTPQPHYASMPEQTALQTPTLPQEGIFATEQEQEETPEWLDTYVNPADIAPGPGSQRKVPEKRMLSSEENELRERCTFETFVVGNSNEFARGAALAVAEQPGTAYNPLFIYGKSGLGKTHLLLSIADYIDRNLPYLTTLYVPADTFTSDYINSLQMHTMPAFEEKYHNVDVLLIDDVQRFKPKGETINQLFNIFNKMTMNNKQIVLSADRSPKEIDLDERMRSRFVQGLLADIKEPEYETRLAIIKNLIAREEEKSPFYAIISEDVQNWLAEIPVPTIRDIQGAITRLVGHMSLGKKTSLSVDEAQEVLKDFFPDRSDRKVTVQVIQSEVERMFKISHEDLVSSKRSKDITYPRHIAIYLSRYMTEESLQDIGKKFGNRDHTTVMHSVKKIEDDQKDNRVLFDQLDKLTKRINESS